MTTVLVTGGAGYIGSHTCKALYRAGYEPVVFDSLVNGHKWTVKWGPLIQGDLLEIEAVYDVFRKFDFKAVLHFAAFAYVEESVCRPGKYYRNNVLGTLNLLEAMHRNKCQFIVFSSSCATYGIPKSVPIKEDACQQPINPYGRSKLMNEQILEDFEAAYGIRSISLRYFNAAGADPEGEIGEDHCPETHLIPRAIETALRGRDKLEIFGSDYPTPDGTAIRDYIHVTDLADAHVKALQYLLQHDTSCRLNLGTGYGVSVNKIILRIEKLLNKTIPILKSPRRSGDPPVLVADARRAQKRLKWSPEFSTLDRIIETAAAWHIKKTGK